MNRIAQLRFDAETHRYTLDGAEVSSVSRILQDAGIVDFGKIDPAVLAKAAARGKAVHAACADHNNGALDFTQLPAEICPYVEQYVDWTGAVRFEPILTECMVLSEKYGYAGTFDGLGEIDGVITLIDIKTGAVPRSVGPQTAAYAYGLAESYDIKVQRRMALQLTPTGYKAEQLQAPQDFNLFLYALNIHSWKRTAA